jgi:hypothetical protein
MKRKSLNIGNAPRSAEDMDKVINRLSSNITPNEEVPVQTESSKEEPDKARVTHYLSTEILAQLEEVYDDLRRRLPYSEKAKVKKSHLVDFALQYLVDDYQKKGDKSLVAREFLKKS